MDNANVGHKDMSEAQINQHKRPVQTSKPAPLPAPAPANNVDGVGFGGLAPGGEVMSGVVRGSAVVAEVVEVLSNAYNTTKTATTYEDDDDDDKNDNGTGNAARRATLNAA